MPPESVRPLGGRARLYERVRRVMPSRRITISCAASTWRFARSRASSAPRVWSPALRGGADKAALAAPNGRHEVDKPRCVIIGRRLKVEHLVRESRRQLLEVRPRLRDLRVEGIHSPHPEQAMVPLALLGGPRLAGDEIAHPPGKPAHLRLRHVDVADGWPPGRSAQEPVALVRDLQDAAGDDRSLPFALRLPQSMNQVGFCQSADTRNAEATRHLLQA